MCTNNRFYTVLKRLILSALLGVAFTGYAQVDTYEMGEVGYLRSPMEAKDGIVLSNNRFSEIYVLKDNKLTSLVQGRGCGIYTQMSKDKQLVGFKSINDDDLQAPAVLDVTTGAVTLLEDYSRQCGQVSFSDDGTMAYTIGDNLIIRKGDSRTSYDLGFYTNIANISPDGTKVAYSNIDGRMFVIDLTTGVSNLVDVLEGYNGVWSPDGSKLAIHTVGGTLSVMDMAGGKIYNLGKGVSASWANNSTELVYTVTEGKHELYVTGSSIKKVRYDGSNLLTLVASSENMPTDAIVTSDNRLLVPYATGEKRGIAKRLIPSAGISTLSVSSDAETMLYTINDDEFGARLGDICKSSKPSITPKAMSQKIGALDIPYLSQIYDSPSINGCTRYGYVTCAPTSACMYLGYYGLLNPVATTSRYDQTTKYYAHHIGNVFTNQAGTYTFNVGAYKYCATIYGGYGYMWNSSSPQSTICDFMKLNGCTSAEKTYVASTAWSRLQSEAAAGRPYIICVALGSSGHVILGFAANCKYRTATGFTEQTGSFVCHDPYGDYNDSSWADGDGQHSTYDWVGYNNGQGNIGTFYWGVNAMPPTSAVEPVTPKITVNPESITLTGEVGSSTATYVDVKVTGENLSTKLSYNSATSAITVSALSGWDDLTGGTLRLTLNTNFSLGAGTYESYVAVQSTSSCRVQIPTVVTLTDPDGGDNSGDNTGDNTGVENPTTDVVSGLTEVWNFSAKSGKTADWITNGSQVTQDMTFLNGKLYVVHRNGGNTDNTIYVVDAYTGEKKGTLSTADCANGIYYLSSIEALGSSILACNLQTSATGELVVYKWDSDTAEPTVLLSTTERPSDVARIGDAMSVSGDMTKGKIWFAYGSNAFYYPITNGVCSTTPTVIALTKDGAAFTVATHVVANVYEEEDGSFWIDSKDNAPIHFSDTGVYLESVSEDLVNVQTTDVKFMKLGSKKYAAAATYLNTTNSSLSDGAFTFFDATGNNTTDVYIAKYPSAGLGSARNTSFRSSICTEVNKTDLNVWVLVPFQGAAYYTFRHTEASGVENVLDMDENAPVEYYNLQGVKVANPDKGIYIKKQGGKTVKVVL